MWYTLYELRVCVYGKERERKNARVREREKRSEGECASATFILCCARKNVNYSKVRPAITYHLLFQIITICSKCNIKKKKKLQISWNKIFCAETRGRIIIPDVFSAEERWKTSSRVVLVCGLDLSNSIMFLLLCKDSIVMWSKKKHQKSLNNLWKKKIIAWSSLFFGTR